MRFPPIAITALLLLSACDRRGEGEGNEAALNAPIPSSEEQASPAERTGGSRGVPDSSSSGSLPDQARTASPDALPAAFRGYWAGLNAACDDSRSDMRLMVGARELRFYESVGRVTGVERDGPGAVIVDASYEGEGQSWTRRQRLTLSRDGDRLTVADQGNAVVRKRCASAP